MHKRVDREVIVGLALYLFWRLLLILVSVIAVLLLPLAYEDRFLGGVKNYFNAPIFYGWANFDGEHYLSIARFGYKSLEHAFFPVYPKIISLLGVPFNQDVFYSVFWGILISNASILIAVILLYKLVKLDFKKEIALGTVVTLLAFPTSFYFGAVYSESFFLLLVVASFWFARQRKWYWVALLGALASATRVFGILLLPALMIEALQQKEKLSTFFWLALIPVGLLIYMTYLKITTGDILAFYSLQTIVGEQHQSGLILLPQVFYRYIKMFLNIHLVSVFGFTVILEFLTGLLFFILPFLGYVKKIRLSYLFFSFFGFLLPTVQGSLSSSPRYVIILFPSFLILFLVLYRLPGIIRIAYYCISIIVLCLATAMFLRGYWIA